MYTLPYFTLGLLFIDIYTVWSLNINGTVFQISFFEYGTHVEGEEISFAFNGYIPPFSPIYSQNVTPHVRSDLESRYTYLRVEYVSPLSSVDIIFDEDTNMLSFYIKFPFLNIPYGVVGYSVKILQRSRMWSSWRRLGKY